MSSPSKAVDVTDAMVEMALETLMDHGVLSIHTDYETDSDAVRAALRAALSTIGESQ